MFSYLFQDHPRSVGETYFEHQRLAFHFAGALLAASFYCAVHAIVPRLFEFRASRAVTRLHEQMVRSRVRGAEARVERSDGAPDKLRPGVLHKPRRA